MTRVNGRDIYKGWSELHLFLGSDSLKVESKLLTLKNVTVNTATLARSGRNSGVKTAGTELGVDGRLDLGVTSTGVNLALSLLGSLNGLGLLDLLTLLLANDNTVVRLVPLTERSGIDLDNGGLGKSVGSDQLVVRGVESNVDNTGLAGNTLRAPREVTGLNTESTELLVTTAGTDGVDSLGSDTGVGGLTTQLKLSLLSELSALGTGVRTLVA